MKKNRNKKKSRWGYKIGAGGDENLGIFLLWPKTKSKNQFSIEQEAKGP